MDPLEEILGKFEPNNLIIFLGFIMPGFVSMKAYEYFYACKVKETNKFIIDAIAYSSLTHALTTVPFYLTIYPGYNISALGWLLYIFLVFILVPCLLSWGWIWISGRIQGSYYTKEPSPWNHFFKKVVKQNEPIWVTIEFTDGSTVAGVVGYTTSYPDEPGIYLSQYWQVVNPNDYYTRAENDRGLIVLTSDIKYMYFSSIP